MVRFLSIMLVLAAVISFNSAQATSSHQKARSKALVVEIFTTTGGDTQWELDAKTKAAHQTIDLQFYALNRIQLVETALSNNLPVNPKQAKQIALQRIRLLDGHASAAIQNTAVGLAKAMQYGVDRHPAIVFDGQAVVYGVTDLPAALAHYRLWRAADPL